MVEKLKFNSIENRFKCSLTRVTSVFLETIYIAIFYHRLQSESHDDSQVNSHVHLEVHLVDNST